MVTCCNTAIGVTQPPPLGNENHKNLILTNLLQFLEALQKNVQNIGFFIGTLSMNSSISDCFRRPTDRLGIVGAHELRHQVEGHRVRPEKNVMIFSATTPILNMTLVFTTRQSPLLRTPQILSGTHNCSRILTDRGSLRQNVVTTF